MISSVDLLEGTVDCKKCGREMVWRTLNPHRQNKYIFGKWSDIVKNVKKCTLINDGYIIITECPYCKSVNEVEMKNTEGNENG